MWIESRLVILLRGCTRFALSWWGGACFRDGWTNLNQTWHGGTFCDSIQDFNPTSPPGGSAPSPKGKILFCGPILTKFDMVIPLATYFKILPQSPSPAGPSPPPKGEILFCGPILTKFGMLILLATYFKILP